MDTTQHDVAIIGGGLAGLTLALQLRRNYPELDVAVIERDRHPVPHATHKVGESTVEIGAHYLCKDIGLQDHLRDKHLRKYGLRLYFQGPPGSRSADLADADEVGVTRLLHVPSYQIDRGILENELGERARAAGVQVHTGCRVTSTAVDRGSHELRYSDGAQQRQIRCRWLVDAAGRHSPLKRSLGVGLDNAHQVNAAWFRVEGRLRVDDWSSSAAWRDRCSQYPRWHSTNHLMGPGYWVWIIPLPSDSSSVGIVADPALHALDNFRSHESTMAWLRQHEPRCAEALADHALMDFHFLRDFSHGCAQVFSDDHWALTGESGVFIDPLYSPGTDFIAISNSFITRLVGTSLAGESTRRRSLAYQQFYFSAYESTLALYQGLYPGFGDRHLMVLKTTWDYAYYWGVLSLLFFSGGLLDERTMISASPQLLAAQKRNREIQTRFRERAACCVYESGGGRFVDQRAMPCLEAFNRGLTEPCSGDALRERLTANIDVLFDLAARLEQRLAQPNATADGRERELLGDLRERLL